MYIEHDAPFSFYTAPSLLQSAVAAGIPVIALTTGQSEAVLREAGACEVVESFNDIMELIKGQQAQAGQ